MNIDQSIPTRASEILVSKICHDLVSPVGAVNNGIEFLGDMGAEGLEDGLGLIEHSARQASVRLQLFRMCYGAGGSDAKTTGKMVYETFQNYVSGTKVSMEWDLMNDMPDQDLPAGFMKTLLNAMVFVADAMPKGGVVSIAMDDENMVVNGVSEFFKAKEGANEALKGELSLEILSPKSIHGYITRAYADLFELSLSCICDDNNAKILIKIP